MSNNANQLVAFWEVVEQCVRRKSIKRLGQDLSTPNLITVQDALILLTLCWHDLLLFGGYPVSNLYPRWLNAILDIDFYDLVVSFKEADELLLDSSLDSYENFKHSLKQTNPLIGAIIAPLKGYIEGWTVNRSIFAFSQLHCAFVFLSRLNLHGLHDLKQKAVEDYLDNEKRLSNVIPTMEECQIITEWFPRDRVYDIMENFFPKHGPGAVSEPCKCLSDKYKCLGTDDLIHYLDNKIGWREADYPRRRTSFARCSRVVLVPKSVTKLRTICAEPATLQWYQQGFLSSLRDYISSHRYLRRRIDLIGQNRDHDPQKRNRDLAWEGSVDGSFSTIDLSAASDSVSTQLVKSWFNKSCLREALWCTRSRRSVLPDGSLLDMNKFAPMGSALCFPIECIVFAAIVEASIREVGDSPMQSRYCIFGDDIVVETKYTNVLFRRLSENGFVVNTSKSFFSTNSPIFRESCGGEYMDGMDVTPIRLSRKFNGIRMDGRYDPSRISACCDLCNRTYTRLPSVRRYIISQLNQLRPEYRVLFSDDGERGVFSPSATNHHLWATRYYHNDYQSDYVKHGGVVMKTKPPLESDEDIRLYEWLRSTCRRDSFNDEIDSRVNIRSQGSITWGRKASML